MTDAKDVSEARRIIERWREESPHLVQPEHWIPPIIALLDSFDTLTRERDAARVVTDAMVERAWRRLVDQCGHEWFDDREDTGLINSPDKEDIRAALTAALTQEDA